MGRIPKRYISPKLNYKKFSDGYKETQSFDHSEEWAKEFANSIALGDDEYDAMKNASLLEKSIIVLILKKKIIVFMTKLIETVSQKGKVICNVKFSLRKL